MYALLLSAFLSAPICINGQCERPSRRPVAVLAPPAPVAKLPAVSGPVIASGRGCSGGSCRIAAHYNKTRRIAVLGRKTTIARPLRGVKALFRR